MIDIDSCKIHMDRPLFWHGIAFITGIWLGLSLSLSFYWFFLLFTLALFFAIISIAGKKPWLLLIISLVLGLYWAGSGIRESGPFTYSENQALEISGMALTNAVANDNGIYRFYLKPDLVNGIEYDGGNLLIYGDGGEIISYGDRLTIIGEILPAKMYHNQNAFDYQSYLLQNNITGIVSAAYGGEIILSGENVGNPFLRFTSRISANLSTAFDLLPGNQGALLQGVFLGDKTGLENDEKNILIEAGIIHAFAVSGLHVGYLLAFVLLLIGKSRKRRWLRLALGSFLLIFYLSLVGFSPSVVRASIMAMIGLWAFCIDEKPDPYVSLAIAAVLIMLYRPALLLNAGFQLSFLAAFGIFYLNPLFDKILPKGPFMSRQAFITTFAATWAVMPVSAYYFHITSLIGWLISPVVLLVIGLVIVISLFSAFLAVLSPLVALIPLYAGGLLIEIIYRFCEIFSELPFSWLTVGTPGVSVIIIYYLLLLILILFIKKVSRLPLVLSAFAIILLIVLPIGRVNISDYASFNQALFKKDKVMEVSFMDVGQGDAAIIIAPSGETILIDGGGNGMDDDDYWIGENVLLPYLKSQGISSIDFIISSHPHADHISGLITVLENMQVRYFLTSEVFFSDPNQEKALSLCDDNGTQIVYLDKGDRYPLTKDIMMEVYSPQEGEVSISDYNAASLVVKLTYHDVDFLFTGDLEGKYLLDVCDEDIEAEVLKIPHHGSNNSYNERFYQKVDPEAAVISVGEDNSYGHPNYKIIEYFEEENVPLYRTDIDGAVTFFTDGYNLETVTNH